MRAASGSAGSTSSRARRVCAGGLAVGQPGAGRAGGGGRVQPGRPRADDRQRLDEVVRQPLDQRVVGGRRRSAARAPRPSRACSCARRSAGRSPTSTSCTSACVNRQLHGRLPSTTRPTATAESSAAERLLRGCARRPPAGRGDTSRPATAASSSTSRVARGSRSSRVRSTSPTDGGTGTWSRCRSWAPTIQRDSSTTKNGLPPVRSCTAEASDRSPGEPSWAASSAATSSASRPPSRRQVAAGSRASRARQSVDRLGQLLADRARGDDQQHRRAGQVAGEQARAAGPRWCRRPAGRRGRRAPARWPRRPSGGRGGPGTAGTGRRRRRPRRPPDSGVSSVLAELLEHLRPRPERGRAGVVGAAAPGHRPAGGPAAPRPPPRPAGSCRSRPRPPGRRRPAGPPATCSATARRWASSARRPTSCSAPGARDGAAGAGGASGSTGPGQPLQQPRVLPQHGLLEVAQLRAGVDAELVAEQLARTGAARRAPRPAGRRRRGR